MKKQCFHLALMAVAGSLLSACSTFDVWQFKPSQLSGSPRGKVALILAPMAVGSASTKVREVLAKDPELAAAIRGQCGVPAPSQPSSGTPSAQASSASPALIPIIAAVAQLGFEAIIDKQRRDVEAINDSASAVYSINVPVAPTGEAGLAGAQCLVILRYAEDDKAGVSEGMSAVLRIRSHPSGTTAATNIISLKPVFIRANNSVAITRAGDKASVNMSFAVSVKAVARENTAPVARLVPAGETVASVRDLLLGTPGGVACATGECGESDLLPYPTNRGVLSLSVAIAEQGKTGFDSKVVDAELLAIKGALGPAIGEAVKTKLGE